jgi:hypothetical protein
VRLEGLRQLKKIIHLIGTRTRDLPVCSIVPQPTTLPRDLREILVRRISTTGVEGEFITSVPFGAKIDHSWNMEYERYPQSDSTVGRV